MKARRILILLIRRTKRFIEFVSYGVFDAVALRSISVQKEPRRVAVVHVELLGDGFLWLPYGQALINTLTQLGNEVVVVCDHGVKELFSEAFPGCQIMPIPSRDFVRSPRARWAALRQLRGLGVESTFHPSNPRLGIGQDAIVRALGASAIGFAAEISDRPWLDRVCNRRMYKLLVPVDGRAHQNLRQRAYLRASGLDDERIFPARLRLKREKPIGGEPYFVLAPGTSRRYRCWPEERFAHVVQTVMRLRPDWCCVIVGTVDEQSLAERIAARFGHRALNLAGKTSVMELIGLIGQARFVLGNDSAAGHIAAAMGAPSVVVVGGGHWGRCYPYDPTEAPVRSLPITVGHPMPCYGCDWLCEHTLRTDRPYPCIDNITVEAVERAVVQIIGGSTAGVVGADSNFPATAP